MSAFRHLFCQDSLNQSFPRESFQVCGNGFTYAINYFVLVRSMPTASASCYLSPLCMHDIYV